MVCRDGFASGSIDIIGRDDGLDGNRCIDLLGRQAGSDGESHTDGADGFNLRGGGGLAGVHGDLARCDGRVLPAWEACNSRRRRFL